MPFTKLNSNNYAFIKNKKKKKKLKNLKNILRKFLTLLFKNSIRKTISMHIQQTFKLRLIFIFFYYFLMIIKKLKYLSFFIKRIL